MSSLVYRRLWGWQLIVALLVTLSALPVGAQDELQQKIEAELARIRPYGLYGNERAVHNLIALAPQMKDARPELITALGDEHMVVRWAAARVLGLVGPGAQAAVPALTEALPGSEWYSQVMIAWALGRMGPAAGDATSALIEVWQQSREVWVKREVIVALGAIGPGAAAARETLQAALHDENSFVRVAAAAALYQVTGDDQGLTLLIEALQNPDLVGPRVAADALAELGQGAQRAVPALEATLEDAAATARVAAARALWRIARNDRGVPQLVDALTGELPEVRQIAGDTLAQIAAATGRTFPLPPEPEAPPQPLVYKAEEWSGPAEHIVKDRWVADKWNLWTEGAPNWSRGQILAAPTVPQDRTDPDEGAPMLHTRLTGIPAGQYEVTVQVTRVLGISVDGGENWVKHDGSKPLGYFTIGDDGVFDLWVDDRYAETTAPGPHYYNTVTLTPGVPPPPAPRPEPVQGWATTKVTEKLDRGLVAIRTDDGVYLSWRLLADDPADLAFDLYRGDTVETGQRVNPEPITRTTDAFDGDAPPGQPVTYHITVAGQSRDRLTPSHPATAPAEPQSYISIKYQGDYKTNDIAFGDLDGDGRMDYVIKQPNTQIWGFLYTWLWSPDTYKLEAYNADGQFMWRQSMGWGTEMGVWFAPYIVRDLDGDGRAEVIFKGAEPDPRDAEGMCNQGAEYVTVLDGMTGQMRCQADWPSREGFGYSAKPGDLAARNQLTVAYLDGKTPCIIAERGTYGRLKVKAYQMKENQLETLWEWDNEELDRSWWGQGAHTLHAADLDGDGRDEVILGSAVIDDNGTGLWTTGLGHPDVCCVGDFSPHNPGLEVFLALETPQKKNGICLLDGRTGRILWGQEKETFHLGSGMVADLDPAHPGCEAWAREDPNPTLFPEARPSWLFNAAGELLGEGAAAVPGTDAVVYWDADVQRELISGGQIRKFGGGAYPFNLVGTVIAVADIMGDWREEIITSLPGELRIYSTTIPATDRRVTLLQDHTYRNALTDISSGYYSQPLAGILLESATGSITISGPTDGLIAGRNYPCQAAVTAPATAELTGTLHLSTSDATLNLTPTTFPVTVPAGETVSYDFTLRRTQPSSPLDGPARLPLNARLQAPAGTTATPTLQTSVLLPVSQAPWRGPTVTEAGDFVAQSGGEARLRTDKPDSGGRALSHWNYRGHQIEWDLHLPTAGAYHLAFRYANSWGWIAERSLQLSGQTLPGGAKVHFPPVGIVMDEWAWLPVRQADGQLAVWNLPAGRQRLVMVNTDDCWLNLDQIVLLPAR